MNALFQDHKEKRLKLVIFERRTGVIGGNQNYIRLLMAECLRTNTEVLLVTPAADKLNEILPPECPIHCLVGPDTRPGSLLVQFFRLWRFLRTLGPGWTLMCNNRGAASIGLLAARLAGLRSIWFIKVSNSSGLIDPILSLLCNRLLFITPQVLDNKHKLAGAMMRRKGENMSIGIDLAPFLTIASPQPCAPLRVCVLARLHEFKAPHVLLDAMNALGADAERLCIDIYGDTPPHQKAYADALRQRIDEEGKGRVVLRGWTADVAGLLSRYDLVALTSRSEGMPRSLVEAMAAARPCVATAVGGVPDLIDHGETGWIVPVDNAQAVADVFRTLCGNLDNVRETGLKARASVEQRFSIHAHLEKLTVIADGLNPGR